MIINKMLRGVCPKSVSIELNDETYEVVSISFNGGCDGNHKALNSLLVGKKVEEFKNLLNISCGNRETSCSSELVVAIMDTLDLE